VTPRPPIFISAVSRELRSARQLVANTLTFLGYQPIWQDIFGTESGDLRAMLRQQISQCKGVVQLVGKCYGAEPPVPDEKFGRVSYTQYEALHARERGKRVWYLFIDENFPADPCEAEPEELRKLQDAYRRTLQADSHVFHSLTTAEGLEASVLKLRDDLTRLRRGVKQWAIGIVSLLLLIVGLVSWQLHSQSELKMEMAKLRQGILEYPQKEAQVHASQPETDPAAMQERVYAELGKELGVDAKTLREKLPRLATELKQAPSASSYERANASYITNDYAEAERLALQAAEEANKTKPLNSKNVFQALQLAGLSAHRGIQYARAMDHFREAEKLTDRSRNVEEWATLQDAIADLLFAQGKYGEAEKLFRDVIAARTKALGPEHPGTLESRHRLVYVLIEEAKHQEAEAEAQQVLALREKVLGSEHPDAVVSRYNLANAFLHEGKYAEAEENYRRIIELDEKTLGPEHPRSIAAHVGLANVLGYEGKNAEAEALGLQIVRTDEKVFGPEHPRTLNDRMNLATTLHAEGKYPAAEAEYERVIRLQEKVLGKQHPDTLNTRNSFAEALDYDEKFAEAETECRAIIGAEEKAVGPEHRLTLNSRGNLAITLIGQKKLEETEAQYKDVMQQLERVLGVAHPDTLDFATRIATLLSHQGRSGEALELASGLEQRALAALGANNPSTQKFGKLVHDLQATNP